MTTQIIIAISIFTVIFLASVIKVLREYDRAVIFRLGRFLKVKGPGLFILLPVIDKMITVSLRTVTMDVPSQDVITRDNVSIKVNAVIYFRVVDPARAILEIENYLYATSQLAQTSLRSIVGELELDEILSQREKINSQLQAVIDTSTDNWGIKVSIVELKHVDLPENMQKAMARQAEAERERRAKVIAAEGELQASGKLNEAAECIGRTSVGIQLRFMQSLTEIASKNSSTTIVPIPIELFKPFMNMFPGNNSGNSSKEISKES